MDTINRKQTHGAPVPATGTAGEVPGLVKKPVVARATSMSERSIDNLVAQKKIPAIKISARCIRFSLPAVMRALERFEIKEATR